MVSLLRRTASVTETEFPAEWAQWRETTERFNLDGEFKLSEWIDVIDTFAKLGRGSPPNLALISPPISV